MAALTVKRFEVWRSIDGNGSETTLVPDDHPAHASLTVGGEHIVTLLAEDWEAAREAFLDLLAVQSTNVQG